MKKKMKKIFYSCRCTEISETDHAGKFKVKLAPITHESGAVFPIRAEVFVCNPTQESFRVGDEYEIEIHPVLKVDNFKPRAVNQPG